MRKVFFPLLIMILLACTRMGAHEVFGKYRITKAYALVHDKGPLFEIETKEIGKDIVFDGVCITANGEKYLVDQKRVIKLSKLGFEISFVGLNYSRIGVEVFGRSDISSILEYRTLVYDDNDWISGSVYFANSKMLVCAQSEYKSNRDWPGDKYFYLAEKIE
jgi:hypothetical protein